MVGLDLEARLVQGQLKSLQCQVGLVLWRVGAAGGEVPRGHGCSYVLEEAYQWPSMEAGLGGRVVIQEEDAT